MGAFLSDIDLFPPLDNYSDDLLIYNATTDVLNVSLNGDISADSLEAIGDELFVKYSKEKVVGITIYNAGKLDRQFNTVHL